MPDPSLDVLLTRATALADRAPRVLIGLVGPPGAGKTSLATKLARRLGDVGIAATRVPMDGFHLADAALAERGLLDRKGAIETFDAHGYVALLGRLLTETDHDVLAPGFERDLEQPLAAAITVSAGTRVVVTEGNYLLDTEDPWPTARALLAEAWFVDLDDGRRRARLVERHVKHGKGRSAAQAWVDDVDEPNAQRVLARRDAADLVVTT